MSHPPSIRVKTSDGGDHCDLGTLTSSCPDITACKLTLHNSTSDSQPCTVCLSSEVTFFLSIHSVHPWPSSSDLISHSSLRNETDVANINLLHSEWCSPCDIVIPPETTQAFVVYLKPSSLLQLPSSSSDRNSSNDKTPSANLEKSWQGRLLFLHTSTRQVEAYINLSGKLGESWLKPDNGLLDFGRCSIDVWSYSELQIHNLNHVPTAFCLSADFPGMATDSDRTYLCFLDMETDQPLNATRVHIAPNGAFRIKVGIRAVAVGDKERWFSVQNLRNNIDVWYIHITAKATSELVAEKMTVSCGSELDFGDCYAHFRTYRDISLQNNYSDSITVAMSSDRKQQITYEIMDERAHGNVKSSRSDSSIDHGPMSSFDAVKGDGKLADDSSSRNSDAGFGQPLRARSIAHDDYFPRRYSGKADAIEDTVEMTSATKTRLAEKIQLWSGQTKNIRVWYLPLGRRWERGSGRNASQEDTGRLHPQRFQLVFKLPTEEARIITGRSCISESVFRLERSEVHLGDCDAFVTYKTTATVINCSDLPAFVKVSYASQCVIASTHEFVIKPRDTFELHFDFVPRQVNPMYHKEITLTNLRNPRAQDLEFTLRANCIDRQGVSLHALFYKLLAPLATNEIDFGVTVANHSAIRAFRVYNESGKQLVLKFEGSCGVDTYVPANALTRSTWVSQRILGKTGLNDTDFDMGQFFPQHEYVVGNDGELSDVERNFRTAVSLLDPGAGLEYLPTKCVAAHDQIDVLERACSWGHQLEARKDDGDTSPSEDFVEASEGNFSEDFQSKGDENWTELLRCVEGNKHGLLESMPTASSNYDTEVQYMERQFEPMVRLKRAMRDGFLTKTDSVCVSPGLEAVVIVSVALTDADVRGKKKLRGFEKRLIVQMLDYDGSRLEEAVANGLKMGVDELVEMAKSGTPREVELTIRACKSQMRVAPLSQLNFGTIRVGEQKEKAFTIVNLSEAPLLYEIGKAGDYDDDLNQLRLNVGGGNRGFVRPYFTKVVPFIYAPCIEGSFEQRFVVRNCMDESANCEVVVKAAVRS